jgi:hypothetical protein
VAGPFWRTWYSVTLASVCLLIRENLRRSKRPGCDVYQ